ncbi:MAG: hypothetical protein RL220_1080 [Bacteroidota bacterium]|jgi:TolA-binding protein
MRRLNLIPFALVFFVIALTQGCSDGSSASEQQPPKLEDPQLKVIANLESEVQVTDTVFDKKKARELLRQYQSYYNAHPQDSLAGIFLYRASKVAQAMGNERKAIELLTNYHDGFPNHPDRADAALMVGLIYDQMQDKKEARKAYERVIQLYPGTPQAADAQGLLNLVDMSNEELLKWLDSKEK